MLKFQGSAEKCFSISFSLSLPLSHTQSFRSNLNPMDFKFHFGLLNKQQTHTHTHIILKTQTHRIKLSSITLKRMNLKCLRQFIMCAYNFVALTNTIAFSLNADNSIFHSFAFGRLCM